MFFINIIYSNYTHHFYDHGLWTLLLVKVNNPI